MKKIIYSLIFSLIAFSFIGCDKKIDDVTYNGGTAPVLSASNTSTSVLVKSNENNIWNSFTWTNPNYSFSTGISSQDVLYTMQIDTNGANFTNPALQEISISKELSKTLTVKDINTIMVKLGLQENIPHNLDIRLKSSLVNATVPLFSNVIKVVLTPYLDVVYPVPAKLYITGSATPGNWMAGGNPELVSQRFTKVTSTKFELTLALSAGNSYLLIPVYGDWSNKYGFDGGGNTNNVNGDNFKPDGNDMKAPPTSGTYKISVEFKTGKWTVTP